MPSYFIILPSCAIGVVRRGHASNKATAARAVARPGPAKARPPAHGAAPSTLSSSFPSSTPSILGARSPSGYATKTSVFKGLTDLFSQDPGEKTRQKYQDRVDAINAMGPAVSKLSDDELRAKTKELQAKVAKGADLDSLLVESFALVREASDRVLGLRPFDVQLIGGMILHEGQIAEMRTGEGKTLVSALPAFLNALGGKGVHVVTVNDYLARRDCEWIGQIHKFLGLKCGLIQAGMAESERRENYN